MDEVVTFLKSLVDQDPVSCKHPHCSKDAKVRAPSGKLFCSEWCYKNSKVIQSQSLRNQQLLSREEYFCQNGCGRHRGIKDDGTMFKYCSPECHHRATHTYFQPNNQRSNSQHAGVGYSQQVSQSAQQQSHENYWHRSIYPWDSILFYDKNDPYYEFTNFYMCRLEIDDNVWPSTEHYFQAQKFIFTPYYYHIRDAPTPRQAFEISRYPDVSWWRRTDWEDVKNQIMLKALLAKFLQHDDLRVMLVKTGRRLLVENSPSDHYWGIGSNGRGENYLGKLLMQVREICLGKPMRPKEEIAYLIDLNDTPASVDSIDTEEKVSSEKLLKLCEGLTVGLMEPIQVVSNQTGSCIDANNSENNQTVPMET